MKDTIYNKQGPTRLYYGFIVRLMVFIAPTKYFRKISNGFLEFCFHLLYFV